MDNDTSHTASDWPNGAIRRPRPDERRRQRYPIAAAKIHFVYTLDDVCKLYNVHSNTVLNWVSRGLRPIDDQSPKAFRGMELNRFHAEQRNKSRTKVQPGELFCLGCKAARIPLPASVRIGGSPIAAACVEGICPDCGSRMSRQVKQAELDLFMAQLSHIPNRKSGDE